MGISQSGLFLLLLYSVATGALLGLAYDAIILVRYILFSPNVNDIGEKHRLINKAASRYSSKRVVILAEWFFVSFTDIIFMITSAISVILVAYTENMGRIRWLIPFGAVVGFALYRFGIGKLTNRISVGAAILARAVVLLIVEYFCRVITKIKGTKINEKTKKGRKRWHSRKKKDEIRTNEL